MLEFDRADAFRLTLVVATFILFHNPALHPVFLLAATHMSRFVLSRLVFTQGYHGITS
jgi:hypothetical protein